MLELAEADPCPAATKEGGAAPAVSVLMAVRNGASYLDEALQSLAAQTFADFETIVVDNGSIDRTAAILAQWTRRESRPRAVRLDGRGLSGSLNRAASMARAPLPARLDGDDVALPHRLAVQVGAMGRQPPLGLFGSAAESIDCRGRRIGVLERPTSDAALRPLLAVRPARG
jgi:glycosyltransferase involved in cell wall biosynthesis